MTKTELQDKITAAQIAGTIAFNSNQKCIPALDRSFDDICQGLEVGQGIEIAKAWIRGWALANLV